MNTSDGSIKYYYLKVTKEGSTRISAEEYKKKSVKKTMKGEGSLSIGPPRKVFT